MQLIGQGKGNPVQVVLGGGTLDMRRAEFGAAGGQAGPPMRVALDRWQITDTIYPTDLSGTFDTAKGMDGAFTARLNGVTIHEKLQINGKTGGARGEPEGTPGVIKLQGHGNPLQFRNVWIVEK